MSFREIGIPPDEFPQDVSGASKIIVLSQDQSQLYTRLGVLGVKTDGFLELASGFLELPERLARLYQLLGGFPALPEKLPVCDAD